MKRILLLACAAAFVLASVLPASAVELNARGEFKTQFSWWQNSGPGALNFDNDVAEESFTALQRARLWFDFIANENLKGVYAVEVGTFHWGDPDAGAAVGNRRANVETLEAYIDFTLPSLMGTNFKAGLQYFALPNNLGSFIWDDRATAILATMPFGDVFSLTAGWARPYNDAVGDPDVNDAVDMAIAIADVKLDGFGIQPFFVYAFIGDEYPDIVNFLGGSVDVGPIEVGKDAKAWWAGFSTQVTLLDPFIFLADFNYGSFSMDKHDNEFGIEKVEGWTFDAAVDYKMDFMTPELFFVYESGENDHEDDTIAIMPTVSPDYLATSFFYDGTSLLTGGATDGNWQVAPLWAVGGKIKDLTFLEGLTHTFTLMYAKGTSDDDCDMYFDKKDSLWEADFDTQYKIFEELTAVAELGYMKPNFDDDRADDAAYRLSLGLVYKF